MKLDNKMITSEVNKWNYLEEDKFHIVEVSRRLENIGLSIDKHVMKTLKDKGQSFKEEHYSSEFKENKNVYWYGAKMYIIAFLDNHCMGGKRNLITKTPALITGMFITLADTFHYTDEDYFYPRLFIYDMAADFVQYYEMIRNIELNENLVKSFFFYFAEYLTNSIQDDLDKEEHTRFFNDAYLCIETDYTDKNKDQNQNLYFAYGSNMDKIQMDHRCPGALPLGICKKIDHKTILNNKGVATIIPNIGSISYGILWKVSNDHIKTLDIYEGVQYETYKKVKSSVMIGGYQFPALVYIAKNDKVGLPRNFEYLETLLRGIKYFNGHSKWYNEIKKLGYVQNV